MNDSSSMWHSYAEQDGPWVNEGDCADVQHQAYHPARVPVSYGAAAGLTALRSLTLDAPPGRRSMQLLGQLSQLRRLEFECTLRRLPGSGAPPGSTGPQGPQRPTAALYHLAACAADLPSGLQEVVVAVEAAARPPEPPPVPPKPVKPRKKDRKEPLSDDLDYYRWVLSYEEPDPDDLPYEGSDNEDDKQSEGSGVADMSEGSDDDNGRRGSDRPWWYQTPAEQREKERLKAERKKAQEAHDAAVQRLWAWEEREEAEEVVVVRLRAGFSIWKGYLFFCQCYLQHFLY